MKNLKPGDPVKHSEGGDKIDALFVGYYTSQSSDCKGTENRVIVRYAGDVKKSNGDWLEKYCVPRNAGDSLPKSELSLSDHIDEVHDKLESKDPVLTKEQKQVMDNILNYSKPLCSEKKMKAEIKTLYTNGVLTQTLINDRDVATEEPSFFLSQVNNAEAAIEKLEKHKSASEFAANEIKRLKNFVVQVYNLLDDKFAAD